MLSESQRSAFRFFRARAHDGAAFSAADVERAVGWASGTFSTYKTKHLKAHITAHGRGYYKVKPYFLRVSEEDFDNIVSQSRKTVARFARSVFDAVLKYEFLLPLTNERKLRAALDELFYRDHLQQRAKEIGIETLATILPKEVDEKDDDYVGRVVSKVGALLGGYSVGHVNGRFRANAVKSYAEAAQILVDRGRYLVDETTAVVRFLLPLEASRHNHGSHFDVTKNESIDASRFEADINVARRLFLAFFVETVILDIHAEDEIWFLESGPSGERLYVLERERPADTNTRTAKKTGKVATSNESQLDLPVGNALETWLRESGYNKVADDIATIVAGWKSSKLKTRRNWWEILAGDSKGNPREVAGIKFPVIASIRKRQELPIAPGALALSTEKPLPP
ncbi:MAG: hypothetical protein K1X67_16255 [Fimbriimonadaceae bacterium]|nr:hypothetical protein [Fimbriimonadaceae bacterium]